MPYRVYKELLNCYERKIIPSFFTPEQNMLGNTETEARPQVQSLRVSLCQHIVTMLETLGFGDDH